MVDVNQPPPLKLPQAFYTDSEIRAYMQQVGQILWQLWRRTGGSSDGISSTQNRDLYDSTAHVAALYQFKTNFQSTSSALTTSGTQCIVVTAAVTITLNDSPADGEIVKIKRATTAGAVTVSGNGKNIDGASTYKILENYESVQIVYSVLDDAWFIV